MTTFRKMGAMKPAIVLRFLERFQLSTIVLSDTDTVWLRDPQGANPMVDSITGQKPSHS